MKLDFRRLTLHLAHTWKLSRTRGADSIEVVVVELTDSDGCLGIGEAAPIARYGESADTVERFLRMLNPQRLSFGELAASMEYLDSILPNNMSAKCAVNIALLDGLARRHSKPLYEFLNLGFRERVHVTSFSVGIDKPEILRRKVQAAQEYPLLKMKVGSPHDLANLRTLREVAPTKPVRLDANEGWKTKEEALGMIEQFAQDHLIQFIEQPLPSSAPGRDWAWLRQRSPLPIFGDESYHLATEAAEATDRFHGVNVKLVKSGGITGALAALLAARQAGLKTMLGCMIETSILISAAAHLVELCDFLDLDGNLLIVDDPYRGVTAHRGVLSFQNAPCKSGLCVSQRA